MDAPTANVTTDVGDPGPLGWQSIADRAGRAVVAPAIAADATATGAAAVDVAADAVEIVAAATATAAPVAPPPAELAPALTDEQRAILDFERQWWRQAGAKEQAIRDRFEVSPTRYYQTLNVLLDAPEALEYDASLVSRLRRVRATGPRGRRPIPAPRSVG